MRQSSENLPVVIEIVDKAEYIQKVLPVIDQIVASEGIITMEKVNIIGYHERQ